MAATGTGIMAANLTDQVRGIVKVVTAVANGNLRQKLTVVAKGEVAALAETINNMNYRARTIGGVLEVKSDERGGTTVTCSLPLSQLELATHN